MLDIANIGKRCIVTGCSNENKDGVSLFKFPKRKEIREQWIKQVKRTRASYIIYIGVLYLHLMEMKNLLERNGYPLLIMYKTSTLAMTSYFLNASTSAYIRKSG